MKFFRYEIVQYSSIDEYGDPIIRGFPNPKVEVREFNLFKETPKGYWIGYGNPDNGLHSLCRWVSKDGRKRYAYPSKEEAILNFIKRTEKRCRILSYQLDSCSLSLEIANHIKISLNSEQAVQECDATDPK